ncbi:hypothetical protein TNIN_213501 [Trichonephila inaurata madagascariensis]|uniref:Uncharacterized protein n=1 Tax=Trichonephila inaurata madagascariensis TaxID=2747483 RepID=A0A8X6WUF9_9ARAC|nr:hypothetical protein TNIN_213501 [Trichonephila inaurata madagascariensis]
MADFNFLFQPSSKEAMQNSLFHAFTKRQQLAYLHFLVLILKERWLVKMSQEPAIVKALKRLSMNKTNDHIYWGVCLLSLLHPKEDLAKDVTTDRQIPRTKHPFAIVLACNMQKGIKE